MQRRFSSSLFGPLFCALVLAICVLVARPFVAMGFNDDWSYIWSARVLAQTGHITYNGWGAMMVGWQLYLGALGMKLFGYTFTAARIGNFLVSLATAALLERVIVRCGIDEWDAVVATLTVALSPLFLPLAFSFMTDITAFFCMLVCLYACLRALQTPVDRNMLAWLAFAALSNLVLGTVRQIAWLGVLVMVPAAVWCLRRRRGAVKVGAILWGVSGVAIFACLQWFKHQQYTFVETLRAKSVSSLKNDIHWGLTTIFLALPVLIAFVVKYPFKRRTWWTAAVFATPVVFVLIILAATRSPVHFLAPFSWDEFGVRGIEIPGTLIGYRPGIMKTYTRVVLTILTMVAVAACVYFLKQSWDRKNSPATETGHAAAARELPGIALFWLLGPYLGAYIFLVLTREFIFDRYSIPVLFVLVVALLRLYEQTIAPRLPALSVIALAILAFFSVAQTHDLYATMRARVSAANQLIAAGVPRGSFYGGLEYDGWTELNRTGYINNPRLGPPAYHKLPESTVWDACTIWWTTWTPQVHAKYTLAYSTLPCMQQAPFGPYPYKTWLAPRNRDLYVLKVPQEGRDLR